MKKPLIPFLTWILGFSCFGQEMASENLDLIFYDQCSGEKIDPEFEIDSLPDSEFKMITVYIPRGEWVSQFSTSLETIRDTIILPKILFATGNELHSQRWAYMACGKIIDGSATDYYSNGNKRLEGSFKNGKPTQIKEYRQNGILLTQTLYKNPTLDFERVSYYNENGELTEYEIYENRPGKTVISTYDKKGNLIKKQTDRN